MPAGVPGMPAESGPFIDKPGMTFPALSRYMSRCAALGAFSLPSIMVWCLSFSRWINQNPPPPKPEPVGSTTASDAVIATAASKALPPCCKILCPALVASGCAVAIAAAGNSRA